MNIIPAIDIIDGKCVRLEQGDYEKKKVYNEDPLEVAKMFEDNGIQYLHLVDLDGAKSSKILNHKVLEKIANATNLQIDFGGGIKSEESLSIALNSGADQVTVGSLATKQPEVFLDWLKRLGSEKLILSADVREGKIATHGWLEDSGLDLINFLKNFYDAGLQFATITDISKDGMLQGPNLELYPQIQKEYPKLNVIASGGVSGIEDLEKLAEQKVYGTILGKAIYEGRIQMKELLKFS